MTFSLEQSIGFVINRLANRLAAELEHTFQSNGHDLTTEQWSVLSVLSQEESLAQHEIARRISRDKTNVARILALMESRHLVERRVSAADNRVREVFLTPSGQTMHDNVLPLVVELLARAQEGMTDAQVDNLIATLNTIYKNLS